MKKKRQSHIGGRERERELTLRNLFFRDWFIILLLVELVKLYYKILLGLGQKIFY